MQTTYQINTNELNINFLNSIKNLFGERELRIVISDSIDETEYLLSSEKNAARLIESIKNVEKNENIIELSFEQLRAFVNEKAYN